MSASGQLGSVACRAADGCFSPIGAGRPRLLLPVPHTRPSRIARRQPDEMREKGKRNTDDDYSEERGLEHPQQIAPGNTPRMDKGAPSPEDLYALK